ncbi:MAG: DUF72 domain-containing protein [Candidatus Hodarchaeota archaeon]
MMNYHIGASGWNYDGWKSTFYPKKLAASRQLEYYSSIFNTIEVNSTFYNIPRVETVKNWHDKTNKKFIFAVKLFQGITHELYKSLSREKMELLTRKYFDAIEHLREKLKLVLIQLPPSFSSRNWDYLAKLLEILPSKHDYAIEFRHETWFKEHTIIDKIKRMDNVIIAGSIHPSVEPFVEKTGDYFAFRFIGDRELTTFGKIQRDKREEMARIKKMIDEKIQDVRDIFVFFNNHYAGFAIESINMFRELVGLGAREYNALDKGQKTLSDFF